MIINYWLLWCKMSFSFLVPYEKWMNVGWTASWCAVNYYYYSTATMKIPCVRVCLSIHLSIYNPQHAVENCLYTLIYHYIVFLSLHTHTHIHLSVDLLICNTNLTMAYVCGKHADNYLVENWMNERYSIGFN